jgi:membrane-associated phospholipid phosphatase
MFALPAVCEGDAAPAPPVPVEKPGALFSGGDGWFAAAAAVGVAVSAFGDGWAWRESQGPSRPETRVLAHCAQRLGDPLVLGPALLAGYVTGHLADRPDFSAASARVAGATLGGAVLCEGLKLAVGRARPDAAPGDPDEFRPFGRLDASFPSGHTTVAFAAASAIDAESRARWVPWVVYPAAAAVGWARVREDQHWLSDVTAGAVLGFWTGRKVDRIERGQVRVFGRTHFLLRGSPRDFRAGLEARF